MRLGRTEAYRFSGSDAAQAASEFQSGLSFFTQMVGMRKSCWFRSQGGLLLVCVALAVSLTVYAKEPAVSQSSTTPHFSDVTSAVGVHFQNVASHTSRKYLIETMGSGVALFDYDNDGRLDIFLVNGAPLKDPMMKDAIPQKTASDYWNRLYHQKGDGTFEDVTTKAGLQGAGYGMGV